jgi:hypothetical protein
MDLLPPEMLSTAPHVTFSIFNLAIPNILAWVTVIIIFCVAVWLRLPKIF